MELEDQPSLAKAPYLGSKPARHDAAMKGKIPGYPQFSPLDPLMEAERINALSALIDDLRARVTELRRYL